MFSKKIKVLVLVAVLLLSFTLSSCSLLENLDLNNDDTVTSVTFSRADSEANFKLTIFSNFKFEFEVTQENGINKTFSLYKGTYTNGENRYDLTMTSGEAKLSTFGVVYSETTIDTEELAALNEMALSAKVISNSACSLSGSVMFVNGEPGSRDSVISVSSSNKFIGYSFNNDYDATVDYYCNLNGTIDNETLLVIHGDGYIESITITEDMLSGLDSSKLGKQEVIVTYAEGKTYTATVLVRAIEDTPIHANLQQYITLNTTLSDFRNVQNNYIYNNSGTIYLTDSEVVITGFDSSKEGEMVITLTYKGASVKDTIIVYDPANLKDKTFDISGAIGVKKGEPLVFTASVTKNNGSYASLDNELVTVSAFDNNTLGAQKVTFTYGSFTVNKVFFVYDDTTKNTIVTTSVTRRSNSGSYSIMLVNGALDFSNHYLKATQVDGNFAEIELTEAMLVDYDVEELQTKGNEYVKVRYVRDGYTYYASTNLSKEME